MTVSTAATVMKPVTSLLCGSGVQLRCYRDKGCFRCQQPLCILNWRMSVVYLVDSLAILNASVMCEQELI